MYNSFYNPNIEEVFVNQEAVEMFVKLIILLCLPFLTHYIRYTL